MRFIVSVDGSKPTVLEAAKDISRSKFIELIAETLGLGVSTVMGDFSVQLTSPLKPSDASLLTSLEDADEIVVSVKRTTPAASVSAVGDAEMIDSEGPSGGAGSIAPAVDDVFFVRYVAPCEASLNVEEPFRGELPCTVPVSMIWEHLQEDLFLIEEACNLYLVARRKGDAVVIDKDSTTLLKDIAPAPSPSGESVLPLHMIRREPLAADEKAIFVVKLLGGGKKVRYDLDASEVTVAQLMRAISDSDGIPEDQQRLIFAGMQLEHHKQLRDYGIVNGANIALLLRLRGD